MVQVVVPIQGDNDTGCDPMQPPKDLLQQRFVWLVERGDCTYSKKAFIAQQSGAYALLVYHNDPEVDVSNVIPCADSIYNNVKIPIILISEEDGIAIAE